MLLLYVELSTFQINTYTSNATDTVIPTLTEAIRLGLGLDFNYVGKAALLDPALHSN